MYAFAIGEQWFKRELLINNLLYFAHDFSKNPGAGHPHYSLKIDNLKILSNKGEATLKSYARGQIRYSKYKRWTELK